MTNTPRYCYKKKDRLSSRKKIEAVFSKGKQFTIFPLKIFWLAEHHEVGLQTGVGVSIRHFKKAVDRNRVKRMMRETYRLQKNTFELQLEEKKRQFSIFILYIHQDLPEYKSLYAKMGKALERLTQILHEMDQ